MIDLERIGGFDWGAGNARKNERHGVSRSEAEQVFLDPRLLVVKDDKHSLAESRFHALGMTLAGRALHIAFTLRTNGTKIRIISARGMSRKERNYYEQEN